VLFLEKPNGEVVVAKAGVSALVNAQVAFAGAAANFGVADESDVDALVSESRGR